MSSLDRSNTTISDPYKGLAVITLLLKDINNAVKDDPAANQKINKATDTFKRISSNIIEVLSLVKGFDFSVLLSPMKDLQAHALKQDEGLAAWAKSSTNMAWTLAFKGQPSSAPLRKRDCTESDKDPSKRLVPASTIIRLDPDESVRVEFLINGKIVYHTEHEILEYWDKEEKMKKAAEEVKLLARSRPEVIKAGETFKKAQDAESLRERNSKKVKRLTELNKRRVEEYIKIYERLKKIPKELVIQSALPAPVPEQASSQTSGRNRNHMELELEVKDDIYKVGMESLVSYLVMASVVKTEENARFSIKLRKLIADHPNQEKLKSKKVKLEALGYHLE
ncbi:hypothetical protein Tco_0077972 [Tanacetum coccineum]